jgi:hypothetical protein
MELQGERVQYYFHTYNKQCKRHITIMLNNHNDEYDHCYSMLHIRNRCIPNTTAATTNVSGYCDYCNQIKTNNNESKAKRLLHLNECRTCFFNQTLPNHLMKNMYSQRSPFQYDYTRKHYVCQ